MSEVDKLAPSLWRLGSKPTKNLSTGGLLVSFLFRWHLPRSTPLSWSAVGSTKEETVWCFGNQAHECVLSWPSLVWGRALILKPGQRWCQCFIVR